MKIIPDEDISEILYKNQLHFSEESKPLMALYLQASFHKGEVVSYSRLKENGPPLCRAENYGTTMSMPVRKTGLIKGQHHGKETPKGNSSDEAQETIKDRQHGECNG